MTIMGESTVTHRRRVIVAEYGEDYSPGPGKFEGETILTYAVWMASLEWQPEQLGDTEGFGWYAVFPEEAVILSTDSAGFVYLAEFDTVEACETAWAELEADYGEWLDHEDPLYAI